MIDGGVVAAYLAAAVARGGERLLGATIDSALDRLSASVARRLGQRPNGELTRAPTDAGALERVGRALEAAAHRDERFARELAVVQDQLDRAGASYLVNEVRARVNVQAFGGGNAHVGDYYEGDRYVDDYDPGDELVAGRGVGRWVAWAGLLMALSGFAGWAYVIFTGFGGSGSGNPFLELELVAGVPLAPVAFGAFGVGGLIYGLGASMSKAARKRDEERRGHRRYRTRGARRF